MSNGSVSIVMPWLTLRVLLSFVVLLASSTRPRTELEMRFKPWPPSAPLNEWIQRVLLQPWNRWDVEYYERIASQGYRLDDGTAQFHPFYPWAGRLAGYLAAGSALAGLLIVNSLCGLLFLLAFKQLAELDFSPGDSRRAAMLFLHWPVAFILFAPYSEGLFLLCSVAAILLARRGSWWRAGFMGGLAALTRQQGIFLALPLAWEFWESSSRDVSRLLSRWRTAVSLLLIPAGLLLWLIYRALQLGDVVFDPYNPRTWIYGLVISRNATKVVTEQGFVMPWKAVATALANPRPTTVVDLIIAGLFLILFAFGARTLWRLRPSYLIYTSVILLVSFSYNTGTYQPYMGLPRHCLLAFPVFLPMAGWFKRPLLDAGYVGLGLLCMAFLTYAYGLHALWVP